MNHGPRKICPAQSDHIDDIAALHSKEIPSLLARLSWPLIRLYYTNAALMKGLLLRVALVNGCFGGFYLATNDRQMSHFKILLLRPWCLLIGLLASPSSAFILLRSYLIKNKVPAAMSKTKLLYFGVSEHFRMKGIGRMLINDLKALLSEKGETDFGVHVEKDNQEAIAFYESMGGDIVGSFQTFGREVVVITFPTS